MLGFTPPEWAYVTVQRTGVAVDQGAARTMDRKVRLEPLSPLRRNGGIGEQRMEAMISTACQLLMEGVSPDTPAADRVETGLDTIRLDQPCQC